MVGTEADMLCPDWIYSDITNVHVAKDRAWFTSYEPFQSKLGSVYNIGAPIPVLGIGTVEFKVKALPGSSKTSTIKLSNVLHVPSYICNVLGQPIKNMYTVSFGSSARKRSTHSRGGLFLSGKQVAHFQSGHVSVLLLAVLPPDSHRFGVSPFKSGVAWAVSCHWDDKEQMRWQAMQEARAACELEPPPYTMQELMYIHDHWGTEFRFLVEHGLKIHEEKDRDKGRRKVRAYMANRDLTWERLRAEN